MIEEILGAFYNCSGDDSGECIDLTIDSVASQLLKLYEQQKKEGESKWITNNP